MALYLDAFGSTDAGKVRKNNEDSLLTGDGKDEALFAVADGIGGFEAGEVASRIAIGVLGGLDPKDSLEEAIAEANRRIIAAAREDEKLSGMGTTVVAARFSVGEGAGSGASAEISHVGDSRAYLLRGGELAPVTEDHSLVAELVRSGDLTRAQASEHPQKNLITRALGAEEEVQVDTAVLPVEPGDRVLLCSDGLTDMVPETKIGELLAAPSPEDAARALVRAALDAGGADNVTVVVVDVKEGPSGGGGRPRSDTQEMRALPQEPVGAVPEAPRRRRGSGARGSSAKARAARGRPKRSAPVRLLTWIVRALAALMVLGALLSPFYLWGSSRHYLGFDSGEVVIYRGLPEEYTLGYTLNEPILRTDLRESEVGEAYREPIDTHKLYSSREDAERVVRDLEDRRTGREGR